MQICYCGWVGKGRTTAPFTCFRWTMVYIALCWYSSILFSKNVRLFLFLYKYYININTYVYIYTYMFIYKQVIYRENSICLCDDKKETLLKQINVLLFDIMWLCAGVLVRWSRRLELKVDRLKKTLISQATTQVAEPVQYFLTGWGVENFIYLRSNQHHDSFFCYAAPASLWG